MSGLDRMGDIEPSQGDLLMGLDSALEFWSSKGVTKADLLNSGMTLEEIVEVAEDRMIAEAEQMDCDAEIPADFRPRVGAEIYEIFEGLHGELDDAQLADLLSTGELVVREVGSKTSPFRRLPRPEALRAGRNGELDEATANRLTVEAEEDFARLRAKDARVHDNPGAVRDAVVEWTEIIIDSDFAVESDERLDGFTHPDDL